jgi:hypothetical protein
MLRQREQPWSPRNSRTWSDRACSTSGAAIASDNYRDNRSPVGNAPTSQGDDTMRVLVLAGLIGGMLSGCASNKAGNEPGTRIRDTTMTPADTTNPNDTLPHIRDSVPDSTRH